MANPVMIEIPGVGNIEAKNAATESTLRELVNAIKGLQKTAASAAKSSAQGSATSSSSASSTANKNTAAAGASMGSANKAANQLSKGLVGASGKLLGMANVAGQVTMKFFEIGAGSAKMIQNLSNVGDSLESAAGALNEIPIVGAALAATFGAVAQAAEKTAKAYQEAASVGANFGGRMNDFINAASTAGMTVEQFGSAMRSAGDGLLAFGATTEDGAKRFGQVSKALRSSSSDLYALGMSTQDINTGLANYGKLLKAQGIQGNMTNSQLATGAKAYLKEMDLLAKMTGVERSAKEAEAANLARDAQFQGAMAGKSEEVRKSFMTTLGGLAGGMQGPLGNFAKDILATGTATTEENQKLMAMMPESAALLNQYKKKLDAGQQLTVEEQNKLQNLMSKEGQRAAKQYGSTFAAAGSEFAGTMNAITLAAGMEEDARKKAKKSQEESAAGTDKLNAAIETAKAKLAAMSNTFTKVLVNSGLLDTLMTTFGVVTKVVETLIVPVFNLFASVLKPIITIISGVLNPVLDVLGIGLQAITVPFKLLAAVAQPVATLFSVALSALVAPLNLLNNVISDTLTDSFYAISDLIEDYVAPPLDMLGRVVGSVGDFFKDLFMPTLQSVSDWFSTTFLAPIKEVADAFKNRLKPVIDPVVSAFETAKNAIGTFFRSFNTLGDVVDAVSLKFDEFKLFVKEMIFAIRDYIPGLTDPSKEEKEALEAEKKELAERRGRLDNKLNKQAEENLEKQKTLEEQREKERADRDKRIAQERALRDKKHYDDKDDREKKYADAREESTKNYDDSLSLLADDYKKKFSDTTQRIQDTAGRPSTPGGAGPSIGSTPSQAPADIAKYLQATALVESGGNASAKAGTSSAGGMFQFIDSTWKQMVKEMGKDYSLQDKFDPKKSAEVMAYFTQKQKAQLEKGTGKQASSTDLYMSHFLGAGGATKFINAMGRDPSQSAAALDPAAAKANKSIYYSKEGKERSLQEVYNLMGSKIAKAESAVESGKWGGKAISADVLALGGAVSPGSKTTSVATATPASTPKTTSVATATPASTPKTPQPPMQIAQAELSRKDMERKAAEEQTKKDQAIKEQSAKAEAEKKAKEQEAPAIPGKPQESVESLLASLNTKMDQLIAISGKTADLNDKQLSVQNGLSGNLFASV